MPFRTRARVLLFESSMRTTLLVLCCVAGCNGGHPVGTAVAAPPKRDLVTKVQEALERMHTRFEASRRLEQAIAFGDLERAHVEARTIADLAEPEMLKEWQPYVENTRAAARQIMETKDLVAAAKLTASLGRTCAKCHEIGLVVLPKDPPPAAGTKLLSQMSSHQWAIRRMWEGLVAPSQERWLDGARKLADAPLTIVAQGDVPPDLAISDDVSRLRLYAKRAMIAKAPDERVELYGDLLATCVRCHAKIRDR